MGHFTPFCRRDEECFNNLPKVTQQGSGQAGDFPLGNSSMVLIIILGHNCEVSALMELQGHKVKPKGAPDEGRDHFWL